MKRRPKAPREFFDCPHCGASVLVGSKVCKECGSDADTGWQSGEEIEYQGLDIPQGWGPEDENDDRVGPGGWWWVALILALVAMLMWAL